jgi:hypothetical protein
MPDRWFVSNAYWRQSSITGQTAHIPFAFSIDRSSAASEAGKKSVLG